MTTLIADEVTTPKGAVVRRGQLYRDRRDDNVRTLRVDGFTDDYGTIKAQCTVIRQEYRGEVTAPMRTTEPSITRLTGSAFVLVVDDRAHLAAALVAHVADTITAAEGVDEVLVDCSCGAEICGVLPDSGETHVGGVQVLMAEHLAEVLVDLIGQESNR